MKFAIVFGFLFSTLLSEAWSQGRSGSCNCSQDYIPFCGTDGVTYPNRCSLDCARSTVRGLQVKFEGVCAEPYRESSGNRGNNNNPGPYIQPTRGPYPIPPIQPTRAPYPKPPIQPTRAPYPTTTRPIYRPPTLPSYNRPTTQPPYLRPPTQQYGATTRPPWAPRIF